MVKLSECEEQVMAIIWKSEVELDVKQIRNEANARFNHKWAQQTVSTYLGRLVKKEYLTSTRKGRNVFYYPEVELEQYRREKMQRIVYVLYEGDSEKAKNDIE